MSLTRRSLINAMARLGGAGAVYEALAALDFLKAPSALGAPLELAKESGRGKTVVILGAGISGLVAAYELDRAGYGCVILEPQRRAGGRSLTLRRGDSIKEMGETPRQVCAFDEGLYFNAGPGRIAHDHVHVIEYCRRFGVALAPYIFASRSNLVHSDTLGNGRAVRAREVIYGLQGHVAEMLDKCARKPGVDLPVSAEDLEKLHELLVQFGDLSKDEDTGAWIYRNGSGRAGFAEPPGVAARGRPISPMTLEEILRSNVWNDWIFRDTEFEWQTSLLEPIGGMDQFVKGFLRQRLSRQSGTLERLIRYGARATAIEVESDKVTVAYEAAGGARTLDADYCICTIPLPILVRLKTNLPAPFMQAAAAVPFMAAAKVGWQAPRFWETEARIYGGISWTTDTIDQIWYPSSGFLSHKGVLTGAYIRDQPALDFCARPLAERLAIAREQGERLHPGFSKYVERGIAFGWHLIEHQEGAWADELRADFGEHATILAQPQGRFHMAGDQITYWSGWQEGAVVAAWHAVQAIDRQVRAAG
jgi:monoamine oxidase